jgi:tetratricopeptide (TPR) repeat protein
MASNLMKYNPAFLSDEDLIRSFVARNSELERVLEVLRENTAGSNQHLLIIGPRGIGKTTLVLRTAVEIRTEPDLSAQWYPVVFGEETYQVSNPGEFWLEALFHLGEQTGEARWKEAYEELRREPDEARLRGRALAQLMDFADEQAKRLALVVENLNMLIGDQIGGDDAWVLRHTLMNEPRLMLIGTATSRFKEVDEYNQALYELFRIIELEPLDDTEAQALWTEAAGQEAPIRQIRPLQILTGGNPRLIRILSEFAANTSFQYLMNDLTRLVDEHTEYFKHHLDSLPPQERKVFVALADLWDPSTARGVAEAARLDVNTTSALLKRLIERGAVTVPYKRGRAQYYQVAERMYNIYHLMRRRGQAASRVHAVVRFMVSLYRDEELVHTTRSLVEEANRLTADQRREHFLAYEAILAHAREPQLTNQIVEATRYVFEEMPDVPESLMRLIDSTRTLEPSVEGEHEGSNNPTLLSLRVEDVEDVNTLLQLAGILSEHEGRLNEAEAAFRKAVQKDPQNVAAWRRFGFFLGRRVKRPAEALEFLDHALVLDAEDVATWLGKSAALLDLGHHEEALESLDRALALDSRVAGVWLTRAIVLRTLERPGEAVESLNHALELDSTDMDVWLSRGMVLDDLGRYEEALDSFDRALELDANDVAGWVNKGSTLLGMGRYEEALQTLDRGLELDANTAAGWINKGFAFRSLGRFEEALRSLERALELDPDIAITWFNRGASLLGAQRYEEALESFSRGLELDANDAEAWLGKAHALRQLGRSKEALEASDRGLELDATSGSAWFSRGVALFGLGRYEEALKSFDRALELDAENATVYLRRGWTNRTMQRFQEAEDDLRRALDLGIQGTFASVTLVELLLESLDRPEDALLAARKAIEKDPGSSELHNSLAWAFFKYGRREYLSEAEAWACSAVNQAPESGYFRHTLASLLGVQGKWDDALEQARVFVRDRAMLDAALDAVIDFFIDAAAAGQGEAILRIIEASGTAETFEPLVVAIQRPAGAQVDVAREILEVATDVLKRIEARRAEIRGS